MNNKEFISALAKRTGRNIEETQRLVNQLCLSMTEIFDEGENIVVSNFGNFEPKKRSERIIINPSTSQRMLVPPKVVLTFKPSANIKDIVKKGGQQ